MGYASADIVWLLDQWQQCTKAGGEYMTWRQLVGRYPHKSDLNWLWGLVLATVEGGYLVATVPGNKPPDPDSRVSWDHWQLTDLGRALVPAE